MATLVWGAGSTQGSNNDWNTATNWTGDTLPANGDDVVLDGTAIGVNPAYTLNTGPTIQVDLNSLTINSTEWNVYPVDQPAPNTGTFIYPYRLFFSNYTSNQSSVYPPLQGDSAGNYAYGDFVITGAFANASMNILLDVSLTASSKTVTFNSCSVNAVTTGLMGTATVCYRFVQDMWNQTPPFYPSPVYFTALTNCTIDVRNQNFYWNPSYAASGSFVCADAVYVTNLAPASNGIVLVGKIGEVTLLGGPSVGSGTFTLSTPAADPGAFPVYPQVNEIGGQYSQYYNDFIDATTYKTVFYADVIIESTDKLLFDGSASGLGSFVGPGSYTNVFLETYITAYSPPYEALANFVFKGKTVELKNVDLTCGALSRSYSGTPVFYPTTLSPLRGILKIEAFDPLVGPGIITISGASKIACSGEPAYSQRTGFFGVSISSPYDVIFSGSLQIKDQSILLNAFYPILNSASQYFGYGPVQDSFSVMTSSTGDWVVTRQPYTCDSSLIQFYGKSAGHGVFNTSCQFLDQSIYYGGFGGNFPMGQIDPTSSGNMAAAAYSGVMFCNKAVVTGAPNPYYTIAGSADFNGAAGQIDPNENFTGFGSSF